MVIKIQMYRMRPEACGNFKATNQDWAAEKFSALKGIIPQLRKLETGINTNRLDWSGDFCVYMEFSSWSALEEFAGKREVREVYEFISKVTCEERQIEFIG